MLFYLQDRLCLLRLPLGKGSFQKIHSLVSKNLGSGSVIGIGEEVCESRTLHAFGIDPELLACLIDKRDAEPLVDQKHRHRKCV